MRLRLQIGGRSIACTTQPILAEKPCGGMSGGGGALVIIADTRKSCVGNRANTQILSVRSLWFKLAR